MATFADLTEKESCSWAPGDNTRKAGGFLAFSSVFPKKDPACSCMDNQGETPMISEVYSYFFTKRFVAKKLNQAPSCSREGY